MALTVFAGFIVYDNPAENLAFNLVLTIVGDALLLVCLFRFGFLPFVLSGTVQAWLRQMPLTSDLSSLHAQGTLITLAMLVVLAFWAGRVALGGRPFLRATVLRAQPAA